MSRIIISPFNIQNGRTEFNLRTRGLGYLMIKSIRFCFELNSSANLNHSSLPASIHMFFKNISTETDLYDTKLGVSLQDASYAPSALPVTWDYSTLLIPTYSCHVGGTANQKKNVLDGTFYGENIKNHVLYQHDHLPLELHVHIQVNDVKGDPVSKMPMLEIDFEC